MRPDSYRWTKKISRAARRRNRKNLTWSQLEPLEQRLCLSIAAPATYQALMSSGVPDPTPVSGAAIIGKTYYVQPGGSDANTGLGDGSGQAWATINHAVAELQPGDTVYVAPGTYNGTVDIADYGNSGTANASINYIADPNATHFAGVAGISPGTITVTGGTSGFLIGHNYILISGFTITGSTITTGINVENANPTSGWVMGTSILNNTIANLSSNNATAINLSGANGGRSTSNNEPWMVMNTTIQGNTIDNISGEGIEAAGVSDFRVNANTIYNVADRGIDVNTLTSDDNENVFLTNNLIYSVRNGITVADTVTNPVETWAGGYTGGPWTYGMVVENNTIVLDNVESVGTTAGVPDPVRWGIRSSRKEWPNVLDTVANNIIISNQSNVADYLFENHDLHPSASILHYYIVPDGELGYNDVYNPEGYVGFENQIANETVGSFSTVTSSEYFPTLADWQAEWLWDYGSISADPEFVNAAAGNYQLSAGSPAIDAGNFSQSEFYVGAYDLNGNARIVNGRIDMGAYSYASTSAAKIPAAPAAPSNLQVTFENTADGLDNLLNWTINSTNEDGFHIEQSLNGVNWQPLYTATGPVNNNYVGVLLPNTTYYYRVAAFNAGGSSAWSNVVSVTTSGPSSAAVPPNPTNLCATIDPDGTQIDLYWLNNDERASNMTIYRSTNGVNFTPITTLIGTTNVYADTNVTPGVTYTYELMASNDVGSSGLSNTASASISGAPVTLPPATPLNMTATTVSPTQINLSWVLADGTDTSVALYVSTNDVNFSSLTTLAAGTTSYNNTGLSASTTYYYYVDAVNSAGPSSNSNIASTKTQAAPTVPGTPTGLTATAVSSSQINLAWTLADSTDTSVVVYTSTNDTTFAALTTLAAGATSYSNTGLAGSTTYYYFVDAVNGVGPSANSNTASAKTQPTPTVPGPPTGLTATAASSSQINLAWTLADATDTSVVVYTSTNDTTFAALTTLAAGATTYSNTGLAGSTTHYYFVDAVNGVGPSSNSNTASAKTQATPVVPGTPTGLTATAVSSSQINLAWTLADTTDTSVVVYTSTNDSTFAALTTLAAGTTTYSNTGLAGSTTYYYYVDAVNGVGPSSNSSTASAKTQATPTVPGAPTGLTATAASSSQINLAWTLADSTDTGVLVYSSTNGTNFTSLATLAAGSTSYSNTSLPASTQYYYYVEAVNAVGPSANSNTASATTQSSSSIQPVYLSTMPFVGTPVNGWGPVMRNVTVGAGNGNPADSNPLTLKGVVYPSGLGVHAYSSVTFALNGQYSTFDSYVGIDDEVAGDPGEVYFQVWGDGAELYGSPLVLSSTPTISVSVNVAGVQQLTLIVTQGGSTNAFDHSDWAEARVIPTGVTAPTAPGAPTGLTATTASSSQVNLSWTLADTTDTDVVVYRSTNPGVPGTFTSIATLAAGTVSYSNTGLSGSTTYYYYVDAVNAVGPSSNSNTASALTQPTPTVPGAPTGMTATAVSTAQINLSWTLADATDTSVVVYSSTNDTMFTALTTLAAGTTTYSNTGLAAATTYYYYVDAVNGLGPSSNSSTASATTQSVATSSQPVYLSTLPFVGTPVNGWGPVMRNVTVGAGNGNPADSNPLTLKGVVYPSGLGAHAYSSVTFALNGQYSMFDSYVGLDDEVSGDPGSVYFQVWGDGNELYSSPLVVSSTPTISVSVSVKGVQQLTLIVTQGGSTNAFDHSDWAEARLIPTGAPIATVPGTPTNFSATAASSSQINLGWTLVDTTDTSVVVYRSTNDTTFSPIATLPAGTASYSDTGLSSSTTYYYEVSAVNSVGPSVGYAIGSATTQAYIPPPSSTVTYVSSLPFVGTPQNGWGPVMHNVTVGAGNGNPADSNPLTLKGVVYSEGLGVHAYSSVTFALNGQYSTFISAIGIDDEVAQDNGSVYFEVWGDGTELYSSPLVTASTPTITVNVSVEGVQQLTLIVVQGGATNSFDHADWAGAELLS